MRKKTEVYFNPWVRKDYQSQSPKILVLGESHYGIEKDYNPDFTTDIIKDWALEREGSRRFFTIIAKISSKILYNRTPDWLGLEDKQFFWSRVAFYNYIQSFVGDAARIRPSESMWDEAKEPFLTVVDKPKPHIIIVLGRSLGNYIKEFEKEIPISEFCYWYHPSAPKYFKTPDAEEKLKKAFEDWKQKNSSLFT